MPPQVLDGFGAARLIRQHEKDSGSKTRCLLVASTGALRPRHGQGLRMCALGMQAHLNCFSALSPGLTSQKAKQQCLEAGMDYHVCKPINAPVRPLRTTLWPAVSPSAYT